MTDQIQVGEWGVGRRVLIKLPYSSIRDYRWEWARQADGVPYHYATREEADRHVATRAAGMKWMAAQFQHWCI